MQEGQVTVGDETVVLPETFWVLATQNPIEPEGTYPLPEAQLDRFLMKLTVGYPDRSAELAMLELPSVSAPPHPDAGPDGPPPIMGPKDVLGFRARAAAIGSRPRSRNTPSTWSGPPANRPDTASTSRPCWSWVRAPAHDRPRPPRQGPCPALGPGLCDSPRREEPGARRPPPPDHRQLRGRRRGPGADRSWAGSSTTCRSPDRDGGISPRARQRPVETPSSASAGT